MQRALLILMVALLPSLGVGDVFKVIIQKQEEKKKLRWSIDEWLKTRDRIRLQDLWFKLHAPSPYEFYIGGEYQHARTRGSATVNAKAGKVMAAAYASIFGIESQYEFRNAYWMAIFHLRFFGYHAQTTNITFNAGIRTVNNPTTYRNPFVGLDMTVNITRHAGVQFQYYYFMRSISNNVGIRTTGHRLEGLGFIDFQFLRVYAGAFTETEHIETGVVNQDNNRWGFHFGSKFFF